jgi:protein-L-isoaspartate(D-aspartate) O-methyltransferase
MKPSLKRMIADIEAEVEYTRSLIGRKALDPRVMTVMGQVPREKFVPHEMLDAAYDNGPLPIGHGQTISQPYIVALMTDLLQLGPDDQVLEIGTGSGYQTAILSCLAKAVYTVEVIPELGEAAAGKLTALNYTNIHYRIGNGYDGWPEYAPYDAIIVTAAAPEVPPGTDRPAQTRRPAGHTGWLAVHAAGTHADREGHAERHPFPRHPGGRVCPPAGHRA